MKLIGKNILIEVINEEYLVYDSFMGSGTTAIGCMKHNIDYIGSELNKTHYQNSLKRISKHNQQKNLF